MTDAVRAVEAARAHPLVDPARIAVNGGSQGGGLALAAAGLVPDLLAATARRALHVPLAPGHRDHRRRPVPRDRPLLQDPPRPGRRRLPTLPYFDGVNFAARAKAPALFSVGLMDEVCPPSTVFAAYNHYAGPKEIEVYPFNGHEQGSCSSSASDSPSSAGSGSPPEPQAPATTRSLKSPVVGSLRMSLWRPSGSSSRLMTTRPSKVSGDLPMRGV